MEGELLKLLQQTKQAGGYASLTFTIRDGKMKAKLEVELDPPAPASPGSTPPLPATAPAPGGGRRCRKGAAAKAKAKARAALYKATKAAATSSPPASGDASSSHPPLQDPLASSCTLRPLQGVVGPSSIWKVVGERWGGGLCHHLPASTWTDHLLLHLIPHHLHSHLHSPSLH